jgi:hypothetical protein
MNEPTNVTGKIRQVIVISVSHMHMDSGTGQLTYSIGQWIGVKCSILAHHVKGINADIQIKKTPC